MNNHISTHTYLGVCTIGNEQCLEGISENGNHVRFLDTIHMSKWSAQPVPGDKITIVRDRHPEGFLNYWPIQILINDKEVFKKS